MALSAGVQPDNIRPGTLSLTAPGTAFTNIFLWGGEKTADVSTNSQPIFGDTVPRRFEGIAGAAGGGPLGCTSVPDGLTCATLLWDGAGTGPFTDTLVTLVPSYMDNILEGGLICMEDTPGVFTPIFCGGFTIANEMELIRCPFRENTRLNFWDFTPTIENNGTYDFTDVRFTEELTEDVICALTTTSKSASRKDTGKFDARFTDTITGDLDATYVQNANAVFKLNSRPLPTTSSSRAR